MTARLGDLRAVEVIRAHDGLVRSALEQHRGRQVKHTGDGIMAVFDTASDGVSSARTIRDGLRDYNRDSSAPIQIRIGLHSGEPVEDSNDLFGRAVQLAARLCAAAEPDGIFVSERVERACADTAAFADAGTFDLKGFGEPVRIFRCI
jgi:class 3 adenylate cyclase